MLNRRKHRSVVAKFMLVDPGITKVLTDLKPVNILTRDFITAAPELIRRHCKERLVETYLALEVRVIVDVIADETIEPQYH